MTYGRGSYIHLCTARPSRQGDATGALPTPKPPAESNRLRSKRATRMFQQPADVNVNRVRNSSPGRFQLDPALGCLASGLIWIADGPSAQTTSSPVPVIRMVTFVAGPASPANVVEAGQTGSDQLPIAGRLAVHGDGVLGAQLVFPTVQAIKLIANTDPIRARISRLSHKKLHRPCPRSSPSLQRRLPEPAGRVGGPRVPLPCANWSKPLTFLWRDPPALVSRGRAHAGR